MLRLWVRFKTWIAKKNHTIHYVPDELDFMRSKTEKDLHDLEKKYQADNIAGIPFDFAYDSITIFRRLFVDCGMNRAWQVFYSLRKYNAYLIHYTHAPLNKTDFKTACIQQGIKKNLWVYKILNQLGLMMAHITVVLEKDHKWYTADYGALQGADDFHGAIRDIAVKYLCKPKKIVVQDINWKLWKSKDL